MVRFVLFPLLGQIVAAPFLSFMLFRSDDAAIGLRVATWNIGSVNRNPFEYYFDDIDKVGIDRTLPSCNGENAGCIAWHSVRSLQRDLLLSGKS